MGDALPYHHQSGLTRQQSLAGECVLLVNDGAYARGASNETQTDKTQELAKLADV